MEMRTRDNRQELEKMYRNLMMDLKSIPQSEHKCLIRFHNCTPYRIIPFWIDFRGIPIEYSVLTRGASINIDTYASHLWFFKIEGLTKAPVKILAITEEVINSSIHFKHLRSHYLDDSATDIELTMQNSMIQSFLICSICKYVLDQHSLKPAKVPCSHFTGEAKFSVSDLQGRSWSSHNNSYIYSCSKNEHRTEHSTRRRNIYLVEPFYNLRERCFLTLASNMRHSDLVEMNLPTSLQADYFKFITTLRKIDENPKTD